MKPDDQEGRLEWLQKETKINTKINTNNPKPGPQPLTISQYRLRQQLEKERGRAAITPTDKPKHRRGGRIARLRRRLAFLKSIVHATTPPPWHISQELWLEIAAIEKSLQKKKLIN